MIMLKYILFCFVGFMSINCAPKSPYTYYPHDNFEIVMNQMDAVNRDNCKFKSWDELTLDPKTLSMIPQYNSLHKVPWVANRTAFLHMHNMALNRGFYYSWILQRLNKSESDFPNLPGLHYYYLSAAADVSANPGIINGSAILFDTHCQYANWMENLLFNQTLPLFGPKAWRLDDWNDEFNWLRGSPTNYTLEVTDYGAGPRHNYTSPTYKFNPWIKDATMQIDFIPDYKTNNARYQQFDFNIITVFDNGTQISDKLNFFGPPQPGEKESYLPVRFTRPFFDCGRSNKWIVASVGFAVDYMARYVPDLYLSVRAPKIVGITTMERDFLRMDFNPCPTSEGNDDHFLAGVARCKPTTMCEPLFGFGFYRGGYQCNCRNGYRLPFYQNGPFQGVDIERATETEYASGFDCIPVQWQTVIPTVKGITDVIQTRKKRSSIEENIDPWNDETTKWLRMHATQAARKRWNKLTVKKFHSKLKNRYEMPVIKMEKKVEDALEKVTEKVSFLHPKHPEPESLKRYKAVLDEKNKPSKKLIVSRKKRAIDYVGRMSGFEPDKLPKVDYIVKMLTDVSAATCGQYAPQELQFPGEVGYGSDKHFEIQGRVALRLAHFLSAYYQNNIKGEKYGNLKPGRTINVDHIYGEVFANVMADRTILASGVFYDRQKFVDDNGITKDLFGPYGFKSDMVSQAYSMVDLSSKVFTAYTENSWFKFIKERWGSNVYGLERQTNKPWIRSDINGSQIQRYFHYPLFFYAPRYEDGYWTNPYFDCQGFVKQWVITYSTPFFGKVGLTDKIEFMGVVTVSVPLSQLDIDQCPGSFYTPNFFKNTATCDYQTTYCSPIAGRHFVTGHYKCECRQGYEYPLADNLWFYFGQTVDQEYRNKLAGLPNRYDTLKCREGIASRIPISIAVWILSILVCFWTTDGI